jgi:hypothetical protein
MAPSLGRNPFIGRIKIERLGYAITIVMQGLAGLKICQASNGRNKFSLWKKM